MTEIKRIGKRSLESSLFKPDKVHIQVPKLPSSVSKAKQNELLNQIFKQKDQDCIPTKSEN